MPLRNLFGDLSPQVLAIKSLVGHISVILQVGIMRTSSCVRLLLLLAASASQVASLQVSVPDRWPVGCQIPVTIARDSDDPTEFAFSYVEPSLDFQEFIADVTDTAVTPTTVVFAIDSPGVFYVELDTDDTDTTALATSGPLTVYQSIATCPPTA
ncbi:hypothetical protein F5890DRAFT_1540086 [Lentinula detonsa]|uniref:Uncharacterized protein n=1 Tax=Lentinula detonsa TaxID=2804962 RepID=A0AA38PT07_9AGAR|nr:hypothetical protein F5890DRAFT_1540086 [Lentinula detonsa]